MPYPITCGDVFYINACDRHGYESVNDLALDNVLYRRDLLTLNVNWQALLPGRVTGPEQRQYWRLSTHGMAILRQSVDALSKECMKSDTLSLLLSETLFLQLALMARRFRHAPYSPYISDAEQLDLLLMALRVNISAPFRLEDFCRQYGLNARTLRVMFKHHTGMGIHHYLRQLRLCKAMDLAGVDCGGWPEWPPPADDGA